jgi:AbrB family looped-hinge helix DNA binding protein
MAEALTEFVARVGEGGSVTIPKEVRELLDVSGGELMRFAILTVKKPKPKE